MTKPRAARARPALPAAPLPTTLRRRGRSQQSAARCPAPGGAPEAPEAPECGARRRGGAAASMRRGPGGRPRFRRVPEELRGAWRGAARLRALPGAGPSGGAARAALRGSVTRRPAHCAPGARGPAPPPQRSAPPPPSPRPPPKAGGATRGPAAPVQWWPGGPTWGARGLGARCGDVTMAACVWERGMRRPCAARRRRARRRGPMRRRGAPRGARAPSSSAPPGWASVPIRFAFIR